MQRYFFDFVSQYRSVFDYKGREFSTLHDALQLAELIALDLGPAGDWAGRAVAIRDAAGEKFVSIPVQESESLAA